MSTRSFLASTALVAALAASVRADVFFVPDDAPTIQSAIELAAPAGDTILVWPGTYRESLDFLGKDVAVRSLAGPELTIIDAERQGTAVSFRSGEGPGAVLDGFTVTGGRADSGGGVFVASGASPTLTSCVLRDNEAGGGGGMYAFGDPAVTACQFVDNVADSGGGAIISGESKTLSSCVFEGNRAYFHGGGIESWGEALNLIDCVFDGNTTVEGWGGAISTHDLVLTIRDCVFARNAPALPYGAIFIESVEPLVTVIDTMFSDNVGDGIHNSVGSTDFVLSGCLFSGNTGSGASANYTFMRVDDCEFRGNGGRGLFVSVGGALVTRSVFSSNSGGGLGLAGGAGHQARIEECVFVDNTSSRGAAVSVGYDSDVTLDRCTMIRNHSTQSGGAVWSAGILRIRDCEFEQNATDGAGGAVFSDSYCSAVDSNFEANQADVGGAVATRYTFVPLPFVDCEFTENTARRGGAFHVLADQILALTRCRVSGNVATEEGGGILSESAALIATSCMIDGNRAAAGGGVYADGATPYDQSRYVNCLFTGNTADTGGGIHLSTECDPAFVNTTFFGNTASGTGGALFCGKMNSPSLANCILWGNDAPAGHEISNASGSAVSIRYSDIEACGGSGGGWDASLGTDAGGNIDADPLFVDAPTTLRLRGGSPCIDAADNTAVPVGVTTDFAGLPRFVDDPLTTDTGVGDPPIVDMGAYENQAACVGDIDGDGRAGFSDIVAILAAWGNPGGPEDLDGSGVVDLGDVIILLASWGPCP